MTKNKIGLLACALAFSVACGDSTSGTDDTTTGGEGTGGTNNAASTTGGGSSPTGGGNTTGGGNSSNGGGSTTGGQSNTTGEDNGEGGVPTTGACTNAADMAIIDANSVEKLACEGAACAGKTLIDGAAARTKCISSEAPTLKMLSPGCNKCFDQITGCVPDMCLGPGECPLSIPDSDFSKCSSPPATDPNCMACNVAKCQPAFRACSGL